MSFATVFIKPSKTLLYIFLVGLLFSCSTPNHIPSDMTSSDEARVPASTPLTSDYYLEKVQPLFNQRCVVCHACNNAPCQLHLDSYAGVLRGLAYHDLDYNQIFADPPTRSKDTLTNDIYSPLFVEGWRKKNFFPVVKDVKNNAKVTDSEISVLKSSVLQLSLELGMKNEGAFELKAILEKEAQKPRFCAHNGSAYRDYASNFPLGGMPYGLPALEPEQLKVIQTWVEQGAPPPTPEAWKALRTPSPIVQNQIQTWETTFHQSVKSQIMARYIYEHVFSAQIHFKKTSSHEWYELVRSSTAAPDEIKEIVTPRPIDPPLDPEKLNKVYTGKVYYRFKRITKTIARSSHIIWEIDNDTLEHYKKLFLDTPWLKENMKLTTSNTSVAPSFQNEPVVDYQYTSQNPFVYFQQIPAKVRYQFLLENSHVIVNGMIRGPACHGHVATNAIRDHFWIFFIKPEADVTVLNPEIGAVEWISLNTKGRSTWKDFSPSLDYATAMIKMKPSGFGISDLWNGERQNPNALLTILRHETSASVHHGLIGGFPSTAWLLNFSNLERIYYNLVAEFEPWGSITHKMATWMSMSLHRSEAEERFISLLPQTFRTPIRKNWTQGLGGVLKFHQYNSPPIGTQVKIEESTNPLSTLISKMRLEYAESQATPATQASSDSELFNQKLAQAQNLYAVRYFPDILYLRINNEAYTIVNHRFFKFNNVLTAENFAYQPSKNKIYFLKGLIGDRPEYFVSLKWSELPTFIKDIQSITQFSEWLKFKNKYFIRRNNPKVWTMLDWFTEWQNRNQPIEAGVIDMREYDRQPDQD